MKGHLNQLPFKDPKLGMRELKKNKKKIRKKLIGQQ